MSEKAAIEEFERVSESTQQSGDISEQSYLQSGGSLAKLFTTFMSSPNQYFRKELGAIRGLSTGRGDTAQHLKTLMIFHVVLPSLFQFVANGFSWDDDDQKRAAILGSLNGIFIFGDAIDGIIRTLLGMKTFGNRNIAVTVFKLMQKTIQAIKKDDYLKATEEAIEVISVLTKTPLKTITDITSGLEDISDGDVGYGMMKLLGYSDYSLRKK